MRIPSLAVSCPAILSLALLSTGSCWAGTFTFTTFDFPGNTSTAAYGINDSGEVVGTYYNFDDQTQHGFLYSGGSFTSIDGPNGAASHAVHATGINNSGQIIGFSQGLSGWESFLYFGGVYTSFAGPEGGEAWGINNNGAIVGGTGTDGFLNDGGILTTIAMPGADRTRALDINNSGEILVQAHVPGTGWGNFLYDGASYSPVIYPLTALGLSSPETPLAQGLNDNGQIVGFTHVCDSLCSGNYGFLASGAEFSTFALPGSNDTEASGINNKGQIAGWYWNGSHSSAFIATEDSPEPCPAGLILGGGLCLIACRNWRSRLL